jgi:hypothetical protein
VRTFIAMILDSEQQQRTMLRLSLETSTSATQLPLRKARAIGWFEDALAPARIQLSDAGVRRLAIAVRSAVGIEALVWLVDIAGLAREDAAELMVSSARAIARESLSGSVDGA